MTSRIVAVGGKPVRLNGNEVVVRKEKTTTKSAQVDNKSKIGDKRVEVEEQSTAKPSEVWGRLPGGKRWAGLGH